MGTSLSCSSSLSIPTLRVGRAECSRSGCSSSFSLQDVILSTRGLYPLWLRIAVISAHVEVLRRKQGAYSGIKAVCILSCISRDAPFGAKPPQAGSHKSLMFLIESKELFYHRGCKFTFQGVDQTLRRPLTVLLFEIAVKGTAYPKTMGNFKKQNFDARGNVVVFGATAVRFRACSG